MKFTGKAPAVAKVFEGKGAGNYNYLLAPVLKQKLFSEMAPMEFPFTYDGTNTSILHFLGPLYGFILADGLCKEDIDAIDIEGKLLILNKFKLIDEHFPVPRTESIKNVIGKNLARLEDALGSGAYFYDLPIQYQIEDHYLNLDIANFLEFLSVVKLIYVNLQEFQKTMEQLK